MTPRSEGFYWFDDEVIGVVPVTVSRDPKGYFVARYLERKWPIFPFNPSLYKGKWIGRIPLPEENTCAAPVDYDPDDQDAFDLA